MTSELIQSTTQKTMSSREIAKVTNKEHKNVCRDIRNMLIELHKEGGWLKFEHTYIEPQNGQSYPEYLLPGFELNVLLTGYSIPLRAKVLKRWEELETGKATPLFLVPKTLVEALRLAADEVEKRAEAELERDRAYATKAYISGKKTATAMATASVAVRQVNTLSLENSSLKVKLGEEDYFRVNRIPWFTTYFKNIRGGYVVVGKELAKLSRETQLPYIKVWDDYIHQNVWAYHPDVIEVFRQRLNQDPTYLQIYRRE